LQQLLQYTKTLAAGIIGNFVFGLVYKRFQHGLKTPTDKAKHKVQIIPVAKAKDQVEDKI
jgi:hypothetical protein